MASLITVDNHKYFMNTVLYPVPETGDYVPIVNVSNITIARTNEFKGVLMKKPRLSFIRIKSNNKVLIERCYSNNSYVNIDDVIISLWRMFNIEELMLHTSSVIKKGYINYYNYVYVSDMDISYHKITFRKGLDEIINLVKKKNLVMVASLIDSSNNMHTNVNIGYVC
jgi:hypothetical protein